MRSIDHANISNELYKFYNYSPCLYSEAPWTNDYLHLVSRWRKTYTILNNMSPFHKRILNSTYDASYRYPVQIITIFEKQTGTLFCTSHYKSLDLLLLLCNKKIKNNLSPEETILLNQIKSEVNKIYKEAHIAFQKGKSCF